MSSSAACDIINLLAPSPGTARHLVVRRWGRPGRGPKAYLQAALHADELPGILVAHHLAALLDAADAEQGILGEVVLVPAANPIGFGQVVDGTHLGRYELSGGENFNRGFPDFAERAAAAVAGTLDGDGPANLARLRAALRRLVAEETPRTELGSLRLALLQLAIDADIVLDLHCDSEALMHVYLGAARWPDGADLAAELGSEATLLADESGGNPFDEVFSGLWTRLKTLIKEYPVPHGALAATVELRGRGNVDDAMAAGDAAALLRFLMRRGVVAGDPGPLPALKTDAVPLAAVDVPRSAAAGMLVYQRAPGDRVRAGDVIADLLDPLTGGRTPIRTQTDGVLFARRAGRLVRPGQTIAKIAGTRPLPTRTGTLLEP